MEQIDLLLFAIRALDKLGIPYAIVGAFASGIWGESRFTQDIDLLVQLKSPQVTPLCAAFPDLDFYVSESAARQAVADHGQFNIIHPASGNKIDFMVAGGSIWTDAQISRRRRVALFPDQDATVAAPEDVILGKLVYYREGGSEKHLRDIAGILKLSGDIVDCDDVTRNASRLGVLDIWQAVKSRVAES